MTFFCREKERARSVKMGFRYDSYYLKTGVITDIV